jgi:hypothetical protein
VYVDNKSLVLFCEKECIEFLSLQFGYHSDNYLCNDGRSDHDCEVHPEVFLLNFGANGEIGIFAPAEIICANVNFFLRPFVIPVEVCAEVEVISVVASNRKMISIDGPILNQLTNYIDGYVCKDNDQIHIEMLV